MKSTFGERLKARAELELSDIFPYDDDFELKVMDELILKNETVLRNKFYSWGDPEMVMAIGSDVEYHTTGVVHNHGYYPNDSWADESENPVLKAISKRVYDFWRDRKFGCTLYFRVSDKGLELKIDGWRYEVEDEPWGFSLSDAVERYGFDKVSKNDALKAFRDMV